MQIGRRNGLMVTGTTQEVGLGGALAPLPPPPPPLFWLIKSLFFFFTFGKPGLSFTKKVHYIILCLILSITKFSIVIGSPRA